MSPEDDLLDQLGAERARSEVVARGTADDVAALIEQRYPFSGSKIDWDRVPRSIVKRISPAEHGSYAFEADGFARAVAASERIADSERVVVVGDSAMRAALEMSWGTLVSCLERILRHPQHTYVVASNGEWCMVFTMEGECCFGRAPA